MKTFPTSSCLSLPLSFKCSCEEIYYTDKSLVHLIQSWSLPHKGSDTDKFFEWLTWLMDRLINMLTALLNLMKIFTLKHQSWVGFPLVSEDWSSKNLESAKYKKDSYIKIIFCSVWDVALETLKLLPLDLINPNSIYFDQASFVHSFIHPTILSEGLYKRLFKCGK